MDEETTYTDEQVLDIAEGIAKGLRKTPPYLCSYLYLSEEFKKGPFGIMSLDSGYHNPLGKFPVEAEVLTMKQKTIVTKIVGKAMTQVGVDHPDYEKDKPVYIKHKSSVDVRDWDLEQRMKNRRNHDF